MKVEQVYGLVNTLTQEYIGEEATVQEDLSNIVDIGSKTINLDNLDKYVRSLIDQIGKIVFVNRPYSGITPSLYMDGWEYGAILEKIQYDDLPEAEENLSWELEDGHSYDPNIFTAPKVSARFFSKKVTYDIPMSFAERQVKSAFQSGTQLNSFFSMIETAISNSMTVKVDSLAMRALNYMTALTLHSNSSIRAVNLLASFNEGRDTALTTAQAMQSPEFIRYAAYVMGLYSDRIRRLTTLFNDGGKERFTPDDRMKLILLSEFEAAAGVYLYSDTYHDNFVHLPRADTVPYWQGSGLDYSFQSTSSINVQINVKEMQGDQEITRKVNVSRSGILGVMFDKYAVAVANLDRRVTANYNGRAEFFNNWYKFDCGYFNDPNENFIVFYVDDGGMAPDQTSIKGLQVSAVPSTETLFDTPVSSMQDDVSISNNRVNGELFFIEGGLAETGPLSGDGNFLALQWSNPAAGITSLKVGLEPSYGTGLVECINDTDRNRVFKIHDNSQNFVIIQSDGASSKKQTFTLGGLQLDIE